MATRVMSTNNSNISNNNNGIVNYQSTSFNMPMNNYQMQIPFLEQGIESPVLHHSISNQSNQYPFSKSFLDSYGRNQQSCTSQQKQNNNMNIHPSYYDNPLMQPNGDVLHQQQHVHNTGTVNNNYMDNQFFSPEHVDGMVSILKGEEDFIHLLDTNTSEPLTSFDFNPTVVTPKKPKYNDHVVDEQQVKSPSSGTTNSSGNDQVNGGSDNATTRTSSPTNSQEKNTSPYPNGRKRASKACVECQKRHTRCGFERPCERCVRLGLNCVEMKSTKKRGRSTMQSDSQNNVTTLNPTDTKLGQSSKKNKSTIIVQSKSETKKRKSSPTNITSSEQQTVPDVKPKITFPSKTSTQPELSENSSQPSSAIITTLTSSTTTNVTQPNNTISGCTSSSPTISTSMYHATTPIDNQMVEKPLGVIATGPDFTSVQYVSDPLSGMFSDQPLIRLESIMGIDFIQNQLNLLCEAKATRETIISHVDNGIIVLQQSHLRAERGARAMIKLKDGKLAEMGLKFVFMYNPANPSILDSSYIFLSWNGSYYSTNH